MSVVLWALIAATLLPCAASSWRGWLAERPDDRTEAFLSRQGLPLPPGLGEVVRARLHARTRAAQVGGWSGWAFGAVLAVAAQMSDAANIVPAVLLGTTALGVAVGAVVGVSRAIADLYPDAPRVAHASATTWRSYCTDWDRRAVLISMAAVGVACLTSVGVWSLAPVPPDGGQLVPVAVLVAGVCVLAGSAALLCLAMALADRPQRAHCDLELAWEDALRSTAVRGLLDVAVGIGLVAVLGVLATSTTWLVDPEVRARGMGLTAALSVAAFAVGVLCWAAALVPWQLGRRVRNPSLVLWRGHDFADAMLRAGAC